ncbi:MAG: hypothetical protein COB50_04820 [Thiotrichales bacterium]|nr:MAG: hypothetical protein COB50_04820 [Thiotrichales bacterium]
MDNNSKFEFTEKELSLISTKREENKLFFIVFLIFYKKYGYFPEDQFEIDEDIKNIVLVKFDFLDIEWIDFDWTSRKVRRFKKDLRLLYNFREFTKSDIQSINDWFKTIIHFEWKFEPLKSKLLSWFKISCIEPPVNNQLERIIRSLLTNHEIYFHQFIHKSLIDSKCNLDKITNSLLSEDNSKSTFTKVKYSYANASYNTLIIEISKLNNIDSFGLPNNLIENISKNKLDSIKQYLCSLDLSEVKRISEPKRSTLLSIFYSIRRAEIIDHLIEVIIKLIKKIDKSAERKVNDDRLKELKKFGTDAELFYNVVSLIYENPDGIIKDVIYPHISIEEQLLFIKSYEQGSYSLDFKILSKIENSYKFYYKRVLLEALSLLKLKTSNSINNELLNGVSFLLEHKDDKGQYYQKDISIPFIDSFSKKEIKLIKDEDLVNKNLYEYKILWHLRDRLKCKDIWVNGSKKYNDPEKDLPNDFDKNKDHYYELLNQPKDSKVFVDSLKKTLNESLSMLNENIISNPKVNITKDNEITLTPYEAKEDSENIVALKKEIDKRYKMLNLLDILKENDFRIGFTKAFKNTDIKQYLNPLDFQKKLLMVLFSYGTNTGIKRVGLSNSDQYRDLSYIRQKYFNKASFRTAIEIQTKHIMKIRDPKVWGKGSATCSSDSKIFGSWDQNIMTEWHFRYKGKGVMIYWHIDKNSACIYSQLKTCTSSEVASMLEGLLRHFSSDDIKSGYVDTHGQSEVGFAFCELLGFNLLPRFKSINTKKLYISDTKDKSKFKNISAIMTKPIKWDLIETYYEEIVRFAVGLKLQTADTQTLFKRFQTKKKSDFHKALCEIGKASKTIFLCRYLSDEKLREEINSGLNIVENWNSANSFIHYAKNTDIATNNLEEQEMCVYGIHLLQNSIVYINTIIIQNILKEKKWKNRLTARDKQALTPLIYHHINPYGSFAFDMLERIDLDEREVA